MTSFSVGDSVRFKDGTEHVDLPMEIGGWQGRITQFEPGDEHLANVKLDSITLQSLPELYILDCEIKGLGWSSYVEEVASLEPCARQDSKADVQATYVRLHAEHTWVHDAGADYGISLAQLEQWQTLWHEYGTFPFRAVVDKEKVGRSGHVPGGSRVRVLGIADYDVMSGLIVNVKHKYTRARLPLYALSTLDKSPKKPDLLTMYHTWFEIYA
jgi:hypothetical protein